MRLTLLLGRFVTLGYLKARLLNFWHIVYCEMTLLTACLALGTQNPDSLILFRVACMPRCLHLLWFSVIISLVKLSFLASKIGLIISSSYVVLLLILPLVRILLLWSMNKSSFLLTQALFYIGEIEDKQILLRSFVVALP